MSLKTCFFMEMLIFMVLIFSCIKDKIFNPISQSAPLNNANTIAEVFSDLEHENSIYPIFPEKEINKIIQSKELLLTLIKESLLQLSFNSHFNPVISEINTRVSCITFPQGYDLGCPYQDENLKQKK